MIKTLFTALGNSRANFLKIFNFISKDKISSDELDLIEEMLIETDIGYDITSDIIGFIEKEAKAGLDLKIKIKSYLLNKLNANSEPIKTLLEAKLFKFPCELKLSKKLIIFFSFLSMPFKIMPFALSLLITIASPEYDLLMLISLKFFFILEIYFSSI